MGLRLCKSRANSSRNAGSKILSKNNLELGYGNRHFVGQISSQGIFEPPVLCCKIGMEDYYASLFNGG